MNDVAQTLIVFCPCCTFGVEYNFSELEDYDPKIKALTPISCPECKIEWAIGMSLLMDIWGTQQTMDIK